MKHRPFARHTNAAPESSCPMCDWEGCLEEGAYKAPKSRNHIGTNNPDDYYHFCLSHVQSYNRAWDYFDGMRPEQIEKFQVEAIHGHRPTWSRDGVREGMATDADMMEALAQFWGETIIKESKPAQVKVAPEVREALAVMGVDDEAPSPQELRSTYKRLVKQYHPDMTKGDKTLEARFKNVTHAYEVLKKHGMVG